MKLLFDENLSPKLALSLQDLFPGSTHVNDCGLGAASDESIWQFASDNGFVIVSKDSDFYDRSVVRRHPPKVVWLRVGNCSTMEIQRLIERAWRGIGELAASEETSLTVRRA